MSTHRNRGFTLMELLIVVAILSILAMLALAAQARAVEQAKADRTRAIISRLDQLIMEKWEGYRVRALPIAINPNSLRNPTTGRIDSLAAARIRLNAMRELQRAELPDRRTDIVNTTGGVQTTAVLPSAPSVQASYYRAVFRATGGNPSTWNQAFQGAECLYLIVATMRDGDKSALDFFSRSEIGDVDDDGMKEILDGWGRPIEFLRWAPGYTRENGAVTPQTSDVTKAPDPFDPLKRDPTAFALKPLIFSPGPDKSYDVTVDFISPSDVVYVSTSPPNYPYVVGPSSILIGTVGDADGDGNQGWMDNITNHLQETP
ncbi:MAG: prepilin-type N-terminal cleavage/methylation domain-containing protein [Pirellulaceae bacterium]|nr:prepilin-type N-terminal cleavage/methylation domain-containing protein [Pirellulaceae bacterium]